MCLKGALLVLPQPNGFRVVPVGYHLQVYLLLLVALHVTPLQKVIDESFGMKLHVKVTNMKLGVVELVIEGRIMLPNKVDTAVLIRISEQAVKLTGI